LQYDQRRNGWQNNISLPPLLLEYSLNNPFR
jgi:hypothetical protein